MGMNPFFYRLIALATFMTGALSMAAQSATSGAIYAAIQKRPVSAAMVSSSIGKWVPKEGMSDLFWKQTMAF